MSIGRDAAGFTLIELMMVIAIVAILAAIAYPSYQDQILKSRRAEGRGLLLETAQALEKCKALYGVYNNASCATVAKITGGNEIDSAEGYYRVSDSGAMGTATFQLQAVPVHSDPECEILTLNQNGAQGEGGTGTVDDCW